MALRKFSLIFGLVALLAIMATSLAIAQSGGIFEIITSTIDGGGGDSTGGPFALSGTIGQHDASDLSSGGDFSLNGGFWKSDTIAKLPDFKISLPIVLGQGQ